MRGAILVLCVLSLAGMAFAPMQSLTYQYLDNGYNRAWCLYLNQYSGMAGSISAYNDSYGPQMSSIGTSLVGSLDTLRSDRDKLDVVAFNGKYHEYIGMMDHATAIYFRSGFDAIQSQSTTWLALFREFNGFQSDTRACISDMFYQPWRNCQNPINSFGILHQGDNLTIGTLNVSIDSFGYNPQEPVVFSIIDQNGNVMKKDNIAAHETKYYDIGGGPIFISAGTIYMDSSPSEDWVSMIVTYCPGQG